MKRKNATRKALFTSMLSLLLCVSMFVGTTFAWFTDEVKSGINTIAAGNLDVELYHSKTTNFDAKNSVEESTNLFTDKDGNEIKNWEPGVVAYTNLQVANEGTLALKYQLSVNFDAKNYVEDKDGNLYSLADALQVAVVAGGFAGDRAEAQKLDNLVSLEDFVLSGKLEGTENSEIYGIVIYWEPGENDNLFNLNNGKKTTDGGKTLSIDLGVNLFATQEMYEEDSFGDDYDGAASWVAPLADTEWYFGAEEGTTEYTISSAEELAGLASLVNGTAVAPAVTFAAEGESTAVQDSFEKKTIKLSSDIDLAGYKWTPIGNWDNAFKGTFDGQGYTISNLYINDTDENTGSGVGLFGVAQNATIKGINVHGANITGYEMVATIVGSPYSGCTISDCHVTGKINIVAEYAYAGGISAYGYVDIDSCSVVAEDESAITAKSRNAVGGIAAWMLEGDNRITNCQVKNLDLTGWTNVGGITGFIHYSNVINGCSVEKVNLTKTRVDGHPGIGMAAGGFSYNAAKAITITNNSFKNITLNGTAIAISSADILWGSEYGGNTNNNFVTNDSNTQETITNNLIYVTKDSNGLCVDDNGVYYISTADELFAFAASVNAYSNYEHPYHKKTIKLMNDIDLGGAEWTPIGDYRFSANRFCGTFDGQGHTISNFKITKKTDKNDDNKSAYGFFGNLSGVVKNLTINGATVMPGVKFVGVLAGRFNTCTCEGNEAKIENCHVINSKVEINNWTIGGLVGQFNDGKIIDCSVVDSSITGYAAVGGIAGIALNAGERTIENCKVVNCDIVKNGSFGGNFDKMFGTIVGALYSGELAVSINGCTSENNTIDKVCGYIEEGDKLIVDGVKYITTAEELKEALNNQEVIELGSDIELTKSLALSNANFVLDGNGFTITMSEDCVNTYALFDITGGKATIKNVTFDGIKGGAVVRTVDTEFVADNVTVMNGEHTQIQGMFRLLGKSTITNCTFKNNTCNMVITFNYDANENDYPQVLKNCVIEGNTCNDTAGVYYVCGTGVTVDGNKFVKNTVSSTGNAATLYLGFTENNVVTNNVFDSNKVTTTSATTKRVAGALMVGHAATITGNAFVNNTVTGANAKGNDVCASVYYTDIDLSGNYWGGSAPVENDNYFVEYTNHNVIINDYLTEYVK